MRAQQSRPFSSQLCRRIRVHERRKEAEDRRRGGAWKWVSSTSSSSSSSGGSNSTNSIFSFPLLAQWPKAPPPPSLSNFEGSLWRRRRSNVGNPCGRRAPLLPGGKVGGERKSEASFLPLSLSLPLLLFPGTEKQFLHPWEEEGEGKKRRRGSG